MATTLPKTVISSPSQSEDQITSLNNTSPTILSRLKFEEAIDKNTTQIDKEAHLKRLKILRKELDYLQNTSWKYASVDNFMGQ